MKFFMCHGWIYVDHPINKFVYQMSIGPDGTRHFAGQPERPDSTRLERNASIDPPTFWEGYLRMSDQELNQCSENQLITIESTWFVEAMRFGINASAAKPIPGASREEYRNSKLDSIKSLRSAVQREITAGREVIRRSRAYIQSDQQRADDMINEAFALRYSPFLMFLAEHYNVPRPAHGPIKWTDVLRTMGRGW